tara:strand:+ start:289 stop:1587 length:1299 start_codon:yes stop_codon:yes gene_type:complete
MNYINNFTLDKSTVSSSGGTITYTVAGDVDAVFSLRVKRANGDFYNFSTGTFLDVQNSKSRLANQVVSKTYSGVVVIPAALVAGDTYTFMLFAEPSKNTLLGDSLSLYNKIYYPIEITQEKDVHVRVSLATDQDLNRFEGGIYDGSSSITYAEVTGSSSTTTNQNVEYEALISDPSTNLGYKVAAPSGSNSFPTIDTSLQPRDEDFYIKVTTQTNGGATNSNSMTVDSVSGLVVGMSLAGITDSVDLEQGGSLGVLTYPTITAINTTTKRVTLSTTPSWGDNKAVEFRAYGTSLIGQSSGVSVSFSNWSFTPISNNGRIDKLANGIAIVNGAVSNSNSIEVDGVIGISVGSKIISGEVSTTSNANVITAIHASGSPITVTGNQTLSTNTTLAIHGSAFYIKVNGSMSVTKLGSADQVIFLDIDRGIVLGTTS